MNFPVKRLRFDFYNIPISNDRNLDPNNYTILNMINFRHFFKEKKIILKFLITWTPYALQIWKTLDIESFSTSHNIHQILFIDKNQILQQSSFTNLTDIKPLILDFFYKSKNTSSTCIEISLYYSDEKWSYIFSENFLQPVFGSIAFDKEKDF